VNITIGLPCNLKSKAMKNIRFTEDEGPAFYSELRQRTESYFKTTNQKKTGNHLMLFKIALYFGLDILFYFLMINSTNAWSFFVFYLLMGLSVLLTAFNISHDAAHQVAVKSKFWNKFLFQLSFNLQGNNAYVWGKNHNESHHFYTNIEGSDIDVLNNPLFRMTESQPRRGFHKYQKCYAPFLYLMYSLNWFFFRDTLMLFNLSSRTIKITMPKLEVFKLILFKLLYIGYMILLPCYLLDFGIGMVLLAFVLNHFMVSLLFVGVLGVSHLSDFVSHPVADEYGVVPMSWAKLQMKTSVDYNPDSVFLNWTLGGFNAHTLHHLLPHICHVHYLEILPVFRELCKKHGLDYQEMGYADSLKSHFRFLDKMGKNPKITSHESQA
jgi:linoleoyl-CoA desaturase